MKMGEMEFYFTHCQSRSPMTKNHTQLESRCEAGNAFAWQALFRIPHRLPSGFISSSGQSHLPKSKRR